MNPTLTEIASGFCWVIYGSFFEWYWHKFWMHTPRTPKEAFRGHTIVHHGLYKGDQSYFVPVGEHPEHILLKPYALPAIILAHIPLMLLIQHFVPYTFVGALISCIVYFVVYEYAHWHMHVPRGRLIERFRWFQFLRKHHHLHHRYFQKNFCVLFPLADLCLGTLITEESVARRKAEREQAIASGHAPQKRRRLQQRIRIAVDERMEPGTRRVRSREARRNRRVDEVRHMLQTSRGRGED